MAETRVIRKDRTPQAVKSYRKKLGKAMIASGKAIAKDVRKEINHKAATEIRGKGKTYARERALAGAAPRRLTGDLWQSVKRKSKRKRGRISFFIKTKYYGRFLEYGGRHKRTKVLGGAHPFIIPVIERNEKLILDNLKKLGSA